MSESLCQRGEVTVNSGADHQLELSTQTLLKHVITILQMRAFTYHFHEVCQTTSQELEERPHYSSHKSASIPPGGEDG